jgi:outer membrane protein OmpA-like peptidoglycan-associated protein
MPSALSDDGSIAIVATPSNARSRPFASIPSIMEACMQRWPWWIRVSVLALGVLPAASPAVAEPMGRHGYIVPFVGYTFFDSDTVGGGVPVLEDRFHVGVRAGYRLHPWVSLELAGGYTPSHQTDPARREVDFLHAAANVLVTPLSGRLRPFLMLGGGASRLKPNGGSIVDQGNAEIGLGADWWFNDGVGLRLEARDVMWLPKGDVSPVLTHTGVLGLGLTFAIGATPRDSDDDGVADEIDQCVGTPPGAMVDGSGCPKDSDGDRVLDGLDQCASTGRGCAVDARGCPNDSDGDGVCDGVDTCADTPKGARVDARGCPADSDGDTVLDGPDQCAGTPRGCTVDSTGCPRDTDVDGVCDGLDRCPDTPSHLRADQNGCPIELIEKETELLDTGMIRVQNINFEPGKAILPPDAHAVLDIVGQVLARWPELRIEVGGHTDTRGVAAVNQKLSEDRAKAVLAYIQGRFPGIEPGQCTARGYGGTRPAVPNTTDLNRARNRRVEFVVLNKDVLRREVERRSLLEKGAPK